MTELLVNGVAVSALAFVQNVSFSLTSRARNRDDWRYHAITAIGSNSIWFFTMKLLIMREMSVALIPFYLLGTVSGSLFGVKVAMRVEQWLGATADGHVKK